MLIIKIFFSQCTLLISKNVAKKCLIPTRKLKNRWRDTIAMDQKSLDLQTAVFLFLSLYRKKHKYPAASISHAPPERIETRLRGHAARNFGRLDVEIFQKFEQSRAQSRASPLVRHALYPARKTLLAIPATLVYALRTDPKG